MVKIPIKGNGCSIEIEIFGYEDEEATAKAENSNSIA